MAHYKNIREACKRGVLNTLKELFETALYFSDKLQSFSK